MRLANHRPAEQSSGLPYSAHQQVVNAVKMNVNLHGAGNQKKQMLGGSVLRDEGSPAFQGQNGRLGGDLPQGPRRDSLEKRNLDDLFSGGHAPASISAAPARATVMRQRIA